MNKNTTAAQPLDLDRATFEAMFNTIHPSAKTSTTQLYERTHDDRRYCSFEVEYAWQTYLALIAQERAARLDTTVSASIADDEDFWALVTNWISARGTTKDYIAKDALIAYIDSRATLAPVAAQQAAAREDAGERDSALRAEPASQRDADERAFFEHWDKVNSEYGYGETHIIAYKAAQAAWNAAPRCRAEGGDTSNNESSDLAAKAPAAQADVTPVEWEYSVAGKRYTTTDFAKADRESTCIPRPIRFEAAPAAQAVDTFGQEVTRLCNEIRKTNSMAWRDSLFEQLMDLIDPVAASPASTPEASRQGAPEPFGMYVERDDGTTEFQRTGKAFQPTAYGYKVWTLYTEPVQQAAAVAAPSDEQDHVMPRVGGTEGQRDADFDSLLGDIMNLPCKLADSEFARRTDRLNYKIGHRDARYAAIDLVSEFARRFRAQGGNTSTESCSAVAATTSEDARDAALVAARVEIAMLCQHDTDPVRRQALTDAAAAVGALRATQQEGGNA